MGCGCLAIPWKARKLILEHDHISDFYLSCCQRNDSALPLLWVRAFLLANCVITELSSLIIWSRDGGFSRYIFLYIYLIRWVRVCVTITIGTSVVISCKAYFKGPIESSTGLPWYVKAYWALFNISASLSFFFTIYYFFFHGHWGIMDLGQMSSLIMLVQLMTSRHPVHILHFYWPLLFVIFYTIFSAIYYLCWGKDPFFLPDPMKPLDWDYTEKNVVLLVGCYIGVVIIHLTTVALASFRDWITRRCMRGFQFNAA